MKTGDKKVVDEINITPLTDIFLVLLIIMMVVAPMLHYRGLPVSFSAPGASATPTPTESKALLIVVEDSGQFVVSGSAVEREALLGRIREDEGARSDGVVVRVDPEASLESMTYVLNAAQLAGIEKVSVEEGAPDAEETAATP